MTSTHLDDTRLWDTFDTDHMLSNDMVDDGDEDFLMMEVEVTPSSEHTENDDNWGLDEQEGKNGTWQEVDEPRTPSQRSRNLVHLDRQNMNDCVRTVTPETQTNQLSLPDMANLQLQYQRGLRRLSRSMRRSDQTRSIVKRQRSAYSQASGGGGKDDARPDFFASSRFNEFEDSRKKLFSLINGDIYHPGNNGPERRNVPARAHSSYTRSPTALY
jgi:hypothetical protein